MIIEKQELVKKISILEKAIPAKASIDSLCGILVRNGTMTASDLNITIQVPVEMDVNESFIIPRSALAVIKKIPDGELKIVAEPGNGILIRTLCADDKARPKVAVDGEDDKLKLSLISGTCEYQETLTLEKGLPGKMEIAFNGRYLLECLKSYDVDTIACSFGTAREPLMTDDGKTRSLVLPVAIGARK